MFDTGSATGMTRRSNVLFCKSITISCARGAPVRPNLIGLTLCRIVSVKDGIVEIDDIDAYDQTPVLDLKPYISSESVPDAKAPQRF